MRHVLLAVVVMFAMLPAVDVVAQTGPPVENPDPGDGGGGGGVLGCDECSVSIGSDFASCSTDNDGGHWADCQGGTICWRWPNGEEECDPYCGESRCYLA